MLNSFKAYQGSIHDKGHETINVPTVDLGHMLCLL